MLDIHDLSFSYPEAHTPVLEEVSFHIGQGILCGLFGPNGCGKSTLFKCCLNLLKPKQGCISINGTPVQKFSPRELSRYVAYVPQEHAPPFPFLVKEVVLMGRTPHLGVFFRPNNRDRKKTEEAMERLNISHLADAPYNTLSGGQRQIVLMARAITQEPKIMFLDEPTSALDFSNQIVLWKIMKTITEQGITIFACTHDPNHIAWFCDKVVVVKNGGIYTTGASVKVMSQKTLDTIYRNTCKVRQVDSIPVVIPSHLNGFSNNVAYRYLTKEFGENNEKQIFA